MFLKIFVIRVSIVTDWIQRIIIILYRDIRGAMLKYTGIRFELLTDIDMLTFVERDIRGDLSQCSHRYAQANNKYNASSYDPSKLSTYLKYFDMNNLYG